MWSIVVFVEMAIMVFMVFVVVVLFLLSMVTIVLSMATGVGGLSLFVSVMSHVV